MGSDCASSHARHEEDVVVDPQRDEEDEREERKARILAGEVGEELEDEKCEAECSAEREHDRPHEHERPDDRTQEQHEDREDDEEHERDEEERVRAHGLAQVELLGRRAADENGVAAGLAQLLPERRDLGEALLAERVFGEGDREECAGLAGSTRPTLTTCGASPAAASTASSCAGSVTSTVVGRRGRERALEEELALDRFDLASEGVCRREVRVERERAEREGKQTEGRADPDGTVPALDPRAEPAPEALLPGGLVIGFLRGGRGAGRTARTPAARR